MPYIDKIVDHINTTLREGTLKRKAFQQGEFYSLAKQVSVTHPDDDKMLRPFIYALNGRKEIDPFLNDATPFQIHHRCNSTQYRSQATNYGDGQPNIIESSQMVAIIYGDPERLKVTQEDLSFLIAAGIPKEILNNQLGNSNLSKINVILGQTNHNSLQVFTAEYQSGNYPLKPQSIYFSITYQIETFSDAGCLSCNDC